MLFLQSKISLFTTENQCLKLAMLFFLVLMSCTLFRAEDWDSMFFQNFGRSLHGITIKKNNSVITTVRPQISLKSVIAIITSRVVIKFFLDPY